jgi:hypothetical protein
VSDALRTHRFQTLAFKTAQAGVAVDAAVLSIALSSPQMPDLASLGVGVGTSLMATALVARLSFGPADLAMNWLHNRDRFAVFAAPDPTGASPVCLTGAVRVHPDTPLDPHSESWRLPFIGVDAAAVQDFLETVVDPVATPIVRHDLGAVHRTLAARCWAPAAPSLSVPDLRRHGVMQYRLASDPAMGWVIPTGPPTILTLDAQGTSVIAQSCRSPFGEHRRLWSQDHWVLDQPGPAESAVASISVLPLRRAARLAPRLERRPQWDTLPAVSSPCPRPLEDQLVGAQWHRPSFVSDWSAYRVDRSGPPGVFLGMVTTTAGPRWVVWRRDADGTVQGLGPAGAPEQLWATTDPRDVAGAAVRLGQLPLSTAPLPAVLRPDATRPAVAPGGAPGPSRL